MNFIQRYIKEQLKEMIREYLPPAGIMYVTVYRGTYISGISNPDPTINGCTGIGNYSTEFLEFKYHDLGQENKTQIMILGEWIDKDNVLLYKDVFKVKEFKLRTLERFAPKTGVVK